MDANDPERGGEEGGITERANIKLLRTLTSKGPDLQTSLASPAANPDTPNRGLHLLGHCLKVTLTSLKRFMKETVANE